MENKVDRQDKINILFLSPLPPPFYGSSISSKECLNILRSSNRYYVLNVRLNYSQSFNDLGSVSIRKVFGFFIALFNIIYYSIVYKPKLVYIMPATAGLGFVRDFTFSLIVKLLNKNILYHLRTVITNRDNNNLVKYFIFKIAFKKQKVIVLGSELIENVKDYFRMDDIYVLPNAKRMLINHEEYNNIKNSRNNNGIIRLLFLSNMLRSKGWPKLIEVAKSLSDKGIGYYLTFAGSWPGSGEEIEYKSLINMYNLSNYVKYVGYVDGLEKHNLLMKTDVLLFPTEYEYETFGRVIIEAMEYGIPVIASKMGTISSIVIHSKNGYLLENNTEHEIVNYIIKLQDNVLRTNMGNNARKTFISNYEISQYKKRFLEIIRKLT